MNKLSEHDLNLRAIMLKRDGRDVLMRIIEKAGYFGDTHSSDPIVTARANGRRSVAVELLADIERVAPDDLQQMMSEYYARRNTARNKSRDDSDD